jgi:hypothetical protein
MRELTHMIGWLVQHYKRLIGIKGVLDILRSYYWYADRPGRSYLDRSPPGDGSTPTPRHLRKRRRLSADEVKGEATNAFHRLRTQHFSRALTNKLTAHTLYTGLRQRLLSWIQVFIQTRETPALQSSEVTHSPHTCKHGSLRILCMTLTKWGRGATSRCWKT